MNQQLFSQYLQEYTRDALEQAGESVSEAADYIEKKSLPPLLSKDRQEKRAALTRLKKVLNESRGRSWYVALKSLGFDDLAKDKL
jgi:hypothetical protein